MAFINIAINAQTSPPTYEIAEKFDRFSIIKLDGLYGVIDTNRIEKVPAKYVSYEKKKAQLDSYELIFLKDEKGLSYIFHPLDLKLTRVAGQIVEINAGKHAFCFIRLSNNKWKQYNLRKAIMEPEAYDSIKIDGIGPAFGYNEEGKTEISYLDKWFTPNSYSDFKYVSSGAGQAILTELNRSKTSLTYDSIKQRDQKLYAAFKGSSVSLYEKANDKWLTHTIDLEMYRSIESFFNIGIGNFSALYRKNGLFGLYYIERNNIVPAAFLFSQWDPKFYTYKLFYQNGYYRVYALDNKTLKLLSESSCDSCHGTGKIKGRTRTEEIKGKWIPATTKTVNSLEYQTLPNGEKSKFKTVKTKETVTVPGYYEKSTYKKITEPDIICPICKGEVTKNERTLLWDGKQLKEVK